MRLTDLIVENSEKEFTGVNSVDDIIQSISPISTIESGLPILVRESEWETLQNPTRLVRSFSFDTLEKLRYFINEMLSYQDTKKHHCTMTVLGMEVEIETYTHDVSTVTEIDLKLSRFADEIYRDTRFFSR